ncbi:hypothetical protein V8E55_011662 [Tylopilus felleus]
MCGTVHHITDAGLNPFVCFRARAANSAIEYHPWGHITMDDQDPGVDLADSVADSQGTVAYMHSSSWCPVPSINTSTSEPMSPYQIALLHEMEALYGAANRSMVSVPFSSGLGTTLEDATKTHPYSATASSAEVHHNATAIQTTHSCLTTASCQWTEEGNFEACSAEIACSSVPAHFGDIHGIRKLNGDTFIYCRWKGCHKWVKRKNFARHVREPHLGHARVQVTPS